MILIRTAVDLRTSVLQTARNRREWTGKRIKWHGGAREMRRSLKSQRIENVQTPRRAEWTIFLKIYDNDCWLKSLSIHVALSPIRWTGKQSVQSPFPVRAFTSKVLHTFATASGTSYHRILNNDIISAVQDQAYIYGQGTCHNIGAIRMLISSYPQNRQNILFAS